MLIGWADKLQSDGGVGGKEVKKEQCKDNNKKDDTVKEGKYEEERKGEKEGREEAVDANHIKQARKNGAIIFAVSFLNSKRRNN